MEKNNSMTGQILAQLRTDIVNCRYDAYELITEGEISARFAVSKTPAREALNFLCQEGLVEKLPHRGYLVKGFSMGELENLFQFRCILETAAVEIAIQSATDEEIARLTQLADQRIDPVEPDQYLRYSELNFNFHLALAQLSRNPILVSTLHNVLNQLRRALTLDWKRADVNALLQGHSSLMAAVAARDTALSRRYVERECTRAESRIFVGAGGETAAN